MEKRAYSVEWLSESSHKNTTDPSVDLLTCRSGTSSLQYHKEFTTPGMERPSTATNCNEKENHIDLTAKLYHVKRTHDVTMSTRAFKEVSLCRYASEKRQGSYTECAKSPGSLSEEDATSRSRTKYTKEQLTELEKSFMDHRYIGSNEKKRLSKDLKLSEAQVKTWFQNRRMKFKRQSQDAQVEALFSGLYRPYYGYSQTLACPVLPGLAMPLAPPASTHHHERLSATVIRPRNSPSFVLPANLDPCPSFFVHPSFKESVGLRYSPY